MKTVRMEYGDSSMDVEVPGHAVIIRPGDTVAEPEHLHDPVQETREALDKPLGSPPVRDLVGPSSQVVVAFPDRVKGGSHPNSHRRVTIHLLLEELMAAGVDEENIKLICANGLHRKNRQDELREYLGDDLVDRFRGRRLANHDPEDPRKIVRLGETARGDVVEVNRDVIEADLAIMLGHAMGNPYGGYSGGYKMPCTGLTTWRCISSHHAPETMHRDDFMPASTHSRFRHQLSEIGDKIEMSMRQRFFAVDAVLDSRSRQIAVFAGNAEEVERESWPAAARRTEVEFYEEKADVLVLGMPRTFHYGPGMGSNPILMLQAIGSSVVRTAHALKPAPVVICTSVCDGWFNDEWFPPYREVYELFQRCVHVSDMGAYEEDMANRGEYIHKFRHAFGYHPFHAFSMLYMGGIALQQCRAVYIAGAQSPGFARGMGCIPTKTFDEAAQLAARHVGQDPKMVVLPDMSKPPIHPRFTKEDS